MLLVHPTPAIATPVMDARRCLFVCLCVCVIGCRVAGNARFGGEGEGHGSICRSNERFLSCGGCQKTCKDPAPECVAVCRTGCYCEEDQVRNETGHCVKLADCPTVAPAKLQSSEPRITELECPPEEEYRSCEPCNKTCDNPNPMCPAQCARGCFCREDLLRDKNGRCVKPLDCSNLGKNEGSNLVKPVPLAYQLTCGPHQEYSSCRSCERTCSSPTPVCGSSCAAGCYCQDGFFKGPDGQCVRLEDCPKAEISYGGAHEPAIEDCSSDEVYLSCGWCEPSCWDPKPECPRGVCTRGCLCRPPLLRHHSGHCVHEKDCTPHKCADPNEDFVCRYGCEARCDARRCFSRPRRCMLGCHCRLGLYRNSQGKCVTLENCQTHNTSNTTRNNSSDGNLFNLLEPSRFDDDLDNAKSVFGPIPEESYNTPLPDKLTTESDFKPYRDIISRAVKAYNEFVGSPTNVPRIIKEKVPRNYREDNGKLDLGNSQYFVTQDSNNMQSKGLHVKQYMSDLLSVMSQIMPQSGLNLTFVNFPLW